MTRESLKGGHFMGGVECEPAPRSWVDALGIALVALFISMLPERLYRRLPGARS